MGGRSRKTLHWAVALVASVGAVCPGVVALWLFSDAATANGSPAGNILRVGLGFLLLLVSSLVLGTASIYLKSNESRPGIPSHFSPSE